MGFGYGFAAYFLSADPTPAMSAYRESFEPSESFERPSAVLAFSRPITRGAPRFPRKSYV
jgi:hypothetical protein